MGATKPEPIKMVKLNLDTAKIMNGVREVASPQYQRDVPIMTKSNIGDVKTVGTIFQVNPEYANEAINTLLNRIGRVYIIARTYMHDWGIFKKGFMELGDKVESFYNDIAQVIVYDPDDAETTVFKKYDSKSYSQINYLNSMVDYPVTIRELEWRQAFLTYSGLSDLVSAKIMSAYNAAQYDEFCCMKYLLQISYLQGLILKKTIPALTSKENIENMLSFIKADSNNMIYYSTKRNAMGARTFTPKDEQIFILDVESQAVTDVSVLAQTFNVDYARYMGIQKMIDSFGENDNERLAVLFAKDPNYHEITEAEYERLLQVKAMLIDRNFLMIVDNLFNMGSIQNPKGLYYNNFLHKWTIYGVVGFAQAIAYTTEATSITGVTVTPATQNISLGSNAQFAAVVAGTGEPSQIVQWEISGPEEFVTISDTGLVSVAQGATVGDTFTVKATSIQNPDVSGTATITIVS